MKDFPRVLAQLAGLALASVLLAPSALATPLGLAVGDEVAHLEFDALKQDGNGAAYFGGSTKLIESDGDITATILTAGSPSTSPIINTDVTYRFDGVFDTETTIQLGPNLFLIQANFLTPGGTSNSGCVASLGISLSNHVSTSA